MRGCRLRRRGRWLWRRRRHIGGRHKGLQGRNGGTARCGHLSGNTGASPATPAVTPAICATGGPRAADGAAGAGMVVVASAVRMVAPSPHTGCAHHPPGTAAQMPPLPLAAAHPTLTHSALSHAAATATTAVAGGGQQRRQPPCCRNTLASSGPLPVGLNHTRRRHQQRVRACGGKDVASAGAVALQHHLAQHIEAASPLVPPPRLPQ